MERDKNGMPKNKKKPTSPTDARLANDLNNKVGGATNGSMSSGGGISDPLESDGMPGGVLGGSSSMMSSFGNSMKSSDDKKKNTYSPGPYWPQDIPLPKETGKDLKESP